MEVIVCKRRMQSNHIRLTPNLVQRHVGYFRRFHFFIFIQIMGKQPAAESGKILKHHPSYSSGADNAHRQILQFPPLYSLKGIILYVRAFHDTLHFTNRHENQHYRIIGDAAGAVGCVGNRYSKPFCRLHINMVVAYGSRSDILYAITGKDLEKLLRHSGRENVYAL